MPPMRPNMGAKPQVSENDLLRKQTGSGYLMARTVGALGMNQTNTNVAGVPQVGQVQPGGQQPHSSFGPQPRQGMPGTAPTGTTQRGSGSQGSYYAGPQQSQPQSGTYYQGDGLWHTDHPGQQNYGGFRTPNVGVQNANQPGDPGMNVGQRMMPRVNGAPPAMQAPPPMPGQSLSRGAGNGGGNSGGAGPSQQSGSGRSASQNLTSGSGVMPNPFGQSTFARQQLAQMNRGVPGREMGHLPQQGGGFSQGGASSMMSQQAQQPGQQQPGQQPGRVPTSSSSQALSAQGNSGGRKVGPNDGSGEAEYIVGAGFKIDQTNGKIYDADGNYVGELGDTSTWSEALQSAIAYGKKANVSDGSGGGSEGFKGSEERQDEWRQNSGRAWAQRQHGGAQDTIESNPGLASSNDPYAIPDPPQFDEAELSKMDSATRANFARQKARALRGSAEAGAYGGAGADQMSAALGETGMGYGLAAESEVAKNHLQAKIQNFQAQMDHYNKAFALKMAEFQATQNRQAFDEAMQMARYSSDLQKQLMAYQEKLNNQIGPGDILGGLLGLGGNIGAAAVGGYMGRS